MVAPGDYDRAHPTSALLVVEVAESSVNKDRLVKAGLYAGAGVPEYWIVDLTEGAIEVHDEPAGDRHTRITPRRAGDVIRLRAFTDADIAVAEILR